MKTLAVSVMLAALAAPAFAQAPEKPSPAPTVEPPLISDVQYPDLTPPAAPDTLPEATTPEARRIQMLKCSGPPMPRKQTAETIKQALEQYAAGVLAPEKASADPVSGR